MRGQKKGDESYELGGNRKQPDLVIEVVVSSEGINKLEAYKRLQIPEVWFWQDGKIKIYRLQDGEYAQVQASGWLPDLDIAHLEQCLLMESQLEAMLAFQERYK